MLITYYKYDVLSCDQISGLVKANSVAYQLTKRKQNDNSKIAPTCYVNCIICIIYSQKNISREETEGIRNQTKQSLLSSKKRSDL